MLERGELEELIASGLTRRQIARTLGCADGKVQYWCGVYGLKSAHRSKRESSPEAIAGRTAGLVEIWQRCPRHGDTRHVIERTGYYRCIACRSERVADRRRKVKEILIAEAGGECVICGYSRSVRALEFHHLDPGEKAFGVAYGGASRSLERMRSEAAKCVLLCSNCHAEVESGVTNLPLD